MFQVDQLTIDQYEAIKKRTIQEKKLEKEEKPLPGMLARKPQAVITKKMYKGGYDDATTVFTPGRWV